MKRILKLTIASCLLFIAIVAFLNLHVILAVQAQANEKIWGTPLTIQESILVSENAEIPKGQFAYVIRKQSVPEQELLLLIWMNMLQGDLSQIRSEIESGIPGSHVRWIRISWASYRRDYLPTMCWVSGLTIEAIVENVNAGLTGAEIVLIIFAVAFLATVIAAIIMGATIVWKIMSAIDQLPPWLSPWVTIVVGLLILAGLGAFLYFLFGGKVSYSSKKGKRNLELGKSKAISLFFYW